MKRYAWLWLLLLALPLGRGLQAQTEAPFWDEEAKKSLSQKLGLKKSKETPSEEALYQEALANFEGKPTWLARLNPERAEEKKNSKYQRGLYFRTNYSQSIEQFKKLIYEYPFTKYLAEAEFYIAEAYYKSKEYEIALQAYQDFLLRHPRHPKAEYVQFQIGLCHFQQRKKNPLRDQSQTELARQAFKTLLLYYPQTSYQKEAKEYLKKCEELLAEKEIKIADFYYKQKEYWSASLRYHYAWSEFPDTSRAEYALFRAGICYQKLNRLQDMEQSFLQLKTSYPETKYLKQIENYLKDK